MENTAFDIWLSNRMDFSDEDKRECLETAKTMVDIAQDVRKNGLLSIDEKIPKMDDAFLRKYIQMAVDSTDPETLQKFMQLHIVANNYKGKELLKNLLIKEGVICIVKGYNPPAIKKYLGIYFGDDFSQEYDEFIALEEIQAKKLPLSMNVVKKSEIYKRYADILDAHQIYWANNRPSGDKLTQDEIDMLIELILKGER